jgi:hypothetical protein
MLQFRKTNDFRKVMRYVLLSGNIFRYHTFLAANEGEHFLLVV